MRPTEDLLRLVDQEGIELRWASLAPYWYGLYVREPSRPPYILLDHSLENRQVPFRAVLAEELGHHFTTEGFWVRRASSRNTIVLQTKVEIRALRWAIDYMIDGHMLLWAWKRYRNPWDVAEYFMVPMPWCLDKLQWMRGVSLSHIV